MNKYLLSDSMGLIGDDLIEMTLRRDPQDKKRRKKRAEMIKTVLSAAAAVMLCVSAAAIRHFVYGNDPTNSGAVIDGGANSGHVPSGLPPQLIYSLSENGGLSGTRALYLPDHDCMIEYSAQTCRFPISDNMSRTFSGEIYELALADADDDGVRELVFTAEESGFGSVIYIVLQSGHRAEAVRFPDRHGIRAELVINDGALYVRLTDGGDTVEFPCSADELSRHGGVFADRSKIWI